MKVVVPTMTSRPDRTDPAILLNSQLSIKLQPSTVTGARSGPAPMKTGGDYRKSASCCKRCMSCSTRMQRDELSLHEPAPAGLSPPMTRTLIVIPARMQATRLPGEPLADIHGQPMIVHVWQRAMAAELGEVVVATDTEAIAAAVRGAGGSAVMTQPDHPSGSDRSFEAVQRIDPEKQIEVVINLQGDFPTIDPAVIARCFEPLARREVDIATLAAEIHDEDERTAPSVVKVVGTPTEAPGILRALYFTRCTAPYGEGPHYHHIGLYAYRR